MNLKRLSATLTLLLVIPLCAHAQANTRRDGNWWNDLNRPNKLAFATGFFDGMGLGFNFSYWGILKDSNDQCPNEIQKSFNDFNKKFFANVTNDQLTDGLDTFYKDYRNRSIKIQNAVWLVVNGIAGTPQSEVDKMIEGWRKAASTD